VLRAEAKDLDDETRVECCSRPFRSTAAIFCRFWPTKNGWCRTLTYFRSLYFRAVRRLCGLLYDAKRYTELSDVCTKASEIDPFEEEVHRYYILSLVRRNKANAALSHYSYVSDLFFRELGIRLSDEMRAIYREIAGTLGSIQTTWASSRRTSARKAWSTALSSASTRCSGASTASRPAPPPAPARRCSSGCVTVADLNGERPPSRSSRR
jgi:hypothetical protein